MDVVKESLLHFEHEDVGVAEEKAELEREHEEVVGDGLGIEDVVIVGVEAHVGFWCDLRGRRGMERIRFRIGAGCI